MEQEIATDMTEVIKAIQETRAKAEEKDYSDIVAECDGVLVDISLNNYDGAHERMDRIDRLTEKHKLEPQPVLKRKFVPPMEGATDFLASPKVRDPNKVDFWGLHITRSILGARGQILPDDYEERYQSLVEKRTMTGAGTGTGAELIEEERSTELLRPVYLETQVASSLRTATMGTGKMKMSELGDATFYKPGGEGQSVTATDLVTAERDFVAYELKAEVCVGDTLNEDSVVALIPEIKSILVKNAAQALDASLLNGDNTGGSNNINKYGADVNGNEYYLLGFNGLIHLPLVENTAMKADLGALATDDFAALLSLMGKYGVNPNTVFFVMDIPTYFKAIQLTGVKTFSDMGNRATILSGQLASIWGVPILVSEQIAKSDANGRVDGATPENNTLGRIVTVNRDAWRFGIRRIVRVNTQRDESKGLTTLVCSMRIALQCYGDRSSVVHTALGYNITV